MFFAPPQESFHTRVSVCVSKEAIITSRAILLLCFLENLCLFEKNMMATPNWISLTMVN